MRKAHLTPNYERAELRMRAVQCLPLLTYVPLFRGCYLSALLTERSRLIDLKDPVSEQLSYTVFSTTITKPTDFTQFLKSIRREDN